MNTPLTFALVLALTSSFTAQATPSIHSDKEPAMAAPPAVIPTEGKEYITLKDAVVSQPKVVEFFSFYCGPCYKFVKDYPVTDAINRVIPAGESVTKYHVSAMGQLGNELTEAWAIAMLTGKTHDVEVPLFEATQGRKLNSIDDIKAIFAKAGIDANTYESSRNSLMVKGLIAKQQAAMIAFGVQSTPTFYVDGKYKINNGGISAATPDAYADAFANVVQALLK
ncbi:DsbA family protein [Erwinia sp. AnSW2-5]|uniref:DsbA family protein n=1 Tax=Erwinia sp. AnSW2-5 TaxID=3367692 RepID=UPI00385FFB7B